MLKASLSGTAAIVTFLTIFFCSCISTHKAIYFDNIQNKEFAEEEVISEIQKGDLLSITVSSLNPEATIIFNTPNLPVIASSSGVNNNTQTTGYLVNSEGNIIFPILGKVKTIGLSEKELTENLTKTLLEKKLLIDPIVNVRIINFRVTVLGEVAKPTVVPVPNEKISMLEAIGMAGDMTLYAKRDNVLLIRVEKGKRITRRINLNAADFLESPYYYLKTNDIVYVEPNKTRVASTANSRQILPIIFSGLSFFAIILDRVFIK